jgi:hypothetical protein
MPCIRSCRNEDCAFNRGGCYCDVDDIEIGSDGTCDTFEPERMRIYSVKNYGEEV